MGFIWAFKGLNVIILGLSAYKNGKRFSHRSDRQPKTYVKPEAAITVFELLMMGGVSPETC
jgi:hypothetical protein